MCSPLMTVYGLGSMRRPTTTNDRQRSSRRNLSRALGDGVEMDASGVLHFPKVGQGTPGVLWGVSPGTPLVRRYTACDNGDYTDAEGFLQSPNENSKLKPVGELVREPRALILGEPWSGKTWIAERLLAQLRTKFAWLVSFEKERATSVPADRWQQWLLSHEHAYVLVDALDEGFYRGADVRGQLAQFRLKGEPAKRLHIMAFSRTSHEQQSLDALGWERMGEALIWHLQPLDSEEAAVQLSGERREAERRIANVRHHVKQLGDRTLVRDFVVLRRLSEFEKDDAVDLADLELFLINTLCEPQRGGTSEALSDRRDAAARMAAVLQFSGAQTLDLDNDLHVSLGPDGSPVRLTDIFPGNEPAPERAARELFRSPLFEATDGRGYRFRQHFAKERLAAYALRGARMELVRRLTTGPRGGVTLAQRPVVERLAASSGIRPAISELAAERARPLEQEEATELFGRLLNWAGARSWNLNHAEQLAMLAHPSVAERVAACLRDPRTSEAKKALALDVARANARAPGWEQVAPVALEIALDRHAPIELRETSVRLLCRHDVPAAHALRRQLEALASEESKDSVQLRAMVLTDMLERGANVLDVAARAPVHDLGSADSRAALIYTLQRRLSDTEARAIIDQEIGLSPATLPPHVVRDLSRAAFERIVELPWNDEDIARIRRGFELRYDTSGHEGMRLVEQKIKVRQANADERRRLFLALAPTCPYLVDLSVGDAEWLAEQLEGGATPHEEMLNTAFRLARNATTAASARTRLRAILASDHAAFLAAAELRASGTQRAQLDRSQLRVEAERKAREGRRYIGEVVPEILNADLRAIDQIHNLGWILFVRAEWRPTNVVGTFDTLGPPLQGKVLVRLAAALAEAEPTEVPSSRRSYSGHLVHEAAAFSATVLNTDASWLTPALVTKWLPTALFVDDDASLPLVTACYRCDQRTTQDALLEALRREATSASGSSSTRSIPNEALDDRDFVSSVLDIAASADARQEAANEIVWSLASRTGSWLANHLTRSNWSASVSFIVQATRVYLRDGVGIGALLESAPSELSFLNPLLPRVHQTWFVDVRQWPAIPLAELAEWLVGRFRRANDPNVSHGHWRIVTEEERYPELRDQVLGELIGRTTRDSASRRDATADAAIERLRVLDHRIDEWVARAQSAAQIDTILSALGPSPAPIPPREVARMLVEQATTTLRGADDLYYVLLEQLEAIRKDTPKFMSKEARLRDYVHQRLTDRLERRFRNEVDFSPEATLGYLDRPDLFAVVLRPNEGRRGVVLEMKWSDDSRGVLEELEKFVEAYLHDQHLAHGIYVVGFTGLSPHVDKSMLEEKLSARAAELEHQYVGTKVAVVVLPVARDKTPRARKKKVASARR